MSFMAALTYLQRPFLTIAQKQVTCRGKTNFLSVFFVISEEDISKADVVSSLGFSHRAVTAVKHIRSCIKDFKPIWHHSKLLFVHVFPNICCIYYQETGVIKPVLLDFMGKRAS